MTTPAQIELLARALAEQYFEGRSSDPWDSAVKYDWDNRDDLHKAGWKLSATAILAQLGPLDPLGAVAMREKAASKATGFLVGDPTNGIPLRSPMSHEINTAIRAIPLPTDADRLAAALAMPEVKALVEALVETNNKLYCMAFKEYDGVWDSEDLSNLTKKGDDALAAIDLNAIGKTQKPAPTE